MTARLLSAVSIGTILLMIFGEGLEPSNLAWKEIVALLFFPAGVFVGLVLAWQDELKGGLLAVLSVTAFYAVYGYAFSGSIRQGWWFLLLTIPGFLFLLYGLITWKQSPSREKADGLGAHV